MEHTKTPWEVYTGHDGQFKGEPVILNTTRPSKTIAICSALEPETNIANAQFIVKAVNNHEIIVSMLKLLLEDYRNICLGEYGYMDSSKQEIINKCKHLLNELEGGR